MAGTRRTRGRPPADDEPLAMLPPPKRKSRARVGEKRRVVDLMSDDEASPTKQEDLDVNEEDLENLQIASSSRVKAGGCCDCALACEVKLTPRDLDPGAVKVEADEGSKATVDADDHLDSKTLQNDVGDSMHDVNNGGGSIAEEEDSSRSLEPRRGRGSRGRKMIYEGFSRRLAPELMGWVYAQGFSGESAAEVPVPKRTIAKRATIQSTVLNDIIDDDSDWEEEFLMTNPNSIYAINLRVYMPSPLMYVTVLQVTLLIFMIANFQLCCLG